MWLEGTTNWWIWYIWEHCLAEGGGVVSETLNVVDGSRARSFEFREFEMLAELKYELHETIFGWGTTSNKK